MTAEALAERLRAGHWVEVAEQARGLRATGGHQVAEIEGVLARAYVRLGQPQEALEASQTAARSIHSQWVQLAIAETALANGQPGTARAQLETLRHSDPSLDGLLHQVELALATVHRASGEAELGYGLACASLDRAEDAHNQVAVEEALMVVGHTAWASNLVPEGEGAFERALESRAERDAAPTLRAEAMDGLGLCARSAGRPFDAVDHHRRALALWTASTGEASGPVSACSHRLAQALHRTGDFEAARNEMSRALLATGATLGRDHVDTWITRFELARYELDCGDPEHGLPRMLTARDEVADRLGRTHPVVLAMGRYL